MMSNELATCALLALALATLPHRRWSFSGSWPGMAEITSAREPVGSVVSQ